MSNLSKVSQEHSDLWYDEFLTTFGSFRVSAIRDFLRTPPTNQPINQPINQLGSSLAFHTTISAFQDSEDNISINRQQVVSGSRISISCVPWRTPSEKVAERCIFFWFEGGSSSLPFSSYGARRVSSFAAHVSDIKVMNGGHISPHRLLSQPPLAWRIGRDFWYQWWWIVCFGTPWCLVLSDIGLECNLPCTWGQHFFPDQ